MKNPYLVPNYYIEKVKRMRAERAERLAALKTADDARAYQRHVREIVAAAFGPFPERTPLNAAVTGVLPCDGYRIEKVRFESRPGYVVTANFYIPNGLSAPMPAVLGACGHSGDGKAEPAYQSYAIRLVKNGFAVLIYDPVHQGERYQYTGLDYLGCGAELCAAPNLIAKQLALVGESMPGWRVWDGIRALDYLLTRPEVDAARVGITGNSGGGTLTEWIWANDSRLAFAAPSCHVTTFLRNLENELPTDAEQCPHGVLAGGLEMVDLMFCQAPKPVILLGQKYDFFDPRGTEEAYGDLRRFYALFGAEGHAALFIGPTVHGYSSHNQKEMVKFFRLAAGLGGAPDESEPVLQTKEALYVLPEGNVVADGSTPIYRLIAEKAEALAANRQPPRTQAEWTACLTDLLRLPPKEAAPPDYRNQWAVYENGRAAWGRTTVETEEGIHITMRKRLAPHAPDERSLDVEPSVTLYLPHLSIEADAKNCSFLEAYSALYALEARGLGDTMPEATVEEFFGPYGMDYMMDRFAYMFNQSYLGLRVHDVLRTLDLLEAKGAREVALAGRGQGAILAAFAALLRPEVSRVILHDAPRSFREWIDMKVCNWPAASVPHGVLERFDLPDLYMALGSRLQVASTWNAFMGDPKAPAQE